MWLSPSVATSFFLSVSTTASDFGDVLINNGIITIALFVGWKMLGRSDDRETKIREDLQTQLEAERAAHAETRSQLIQLLQDKS